MLLAQGWVPVAGGVRAGTGSQLLLATANSWFSHVPLKAHRPEQVRRALRSGRAGQGGSELIATALVRRCFGCVPAHSRRF